MVVQVVVHLLLIQVTQVDLVVAVVAEVVNQEEMETVLQYLLLKDKMEVRQNLLPALLKTKVVVAEVLVLLVLMVHLQQAVLVVVV